LRPPVTENPRNFRTIRSGPGECGVVAARPAAIVSDDPARRGECGAIEADPHADLVGLIRGRPRVSPAAAAQFTSERGETALQRTDNTRCDPRGIPVHAYHGTERREPERMRQAAQQIIAP
jgi:hypothetical protein